MQHTIFNLLALFYGLEIILTGSILPPSDNLPWLAFKEFAYALDPLSWDDPANPTIDPCLTPYCLYPGLFMYQVFNSCNLTLTKQLDKNQNPPSVAKLKSIISDCICGDPSRDTNSLISSMFEQCTSCYHSFNKTKLNSTTWIKACSCVDPSPYEALLNMGDPTYCKKVSVKNRNPGVQNRPFPAQIPVQVNQTTSNSASTSGLPPSAPTSSMA
ncbi:hypothetical protein HDU92_001168 [Lobulomyces angularis]|nr:hypothetical protein HDU92_001168 [Lobulomyces angularis]